MKKTAFLLLFAFICANAFAQSSPDSLKAQLEQAEGEDRTAILVDLAESLYEAEPENAISYARQALTRLNTGDERWSRVLFWKGIAHVATGGTHLDSAWALSEQLMQRSESSGDRHGEADAHYLVGRIHRGRGELDESLVSVLVAANRYKEANVTRGSVVALRQAGYLVGFEFSFDEKYSSQIDFDLAISYLEEALLLASDLDDKALIADLFYKAGRIERGRTHSILWGTDASSSSDEGILFGSEMDPNAVAVSYFEQATAIFKELKDYEMIESSYSEVITMYSNTDDGDEVLRFAGDLLTYMDAEGQHGPAQYALFMIASVHLTRSNYSEALSAWQRKLTIAEEADSRGDIARAYATIGYIHQQQGDFVEALSYFRRAVAVQEELGEAPWSILNIADIYFEQGDLDEALPLYERALIDAEAYIANTPDYTPMTHGRVTAHPIIGIANVHRVQGNFEEALSFFGRALDLLSIGLDQDEYTRVLKSMGQIHTELGNYAEALSMLDQARSIMANVGDRAGLAETFQAISALYRKQGRSQEALIYADSSLALADSAGATPARPGCPAGAQPHIGATRPIRGSIECPSCLQERQ